MPRCGLYVSFIVSSSVVIHCIFHGGPLVVNNLGFLSLSTVTPRFLPLSTITSHFLPLLTVASHFIPLLTITPAWVEGVAGSIWVVVRGSLPSLGVVSLGRPRSPKLLWGVIPDLSPGDLFCLVAC